MEDRPSPVGQTPPGSGWGYPRWCVPVDPKRLARAKGRIARAAAGMRLRDYTPTPDYLACTYCAFRDICPSSVAR